MSDSSSGVNPFDALAEEFVARHRAGEKPSVSEYAAKYPKLADDIRDLFPGLLLMEDVRPAAGDATGSCSAISPGPGPTPGRLGDYRIVREVGRGGMGVVYEAEQVSLGRHVALKVLPAHGLMNPTFLERFRREAKAAARLHHTNIVPVYGVGEADGVHFYAMQFIAGQSLHQVLHDLRRLRKPPLTPTPLPRGERGRGEGAGDANATGAVSVAQGLLTGQFTAAAAPAAEEPADTPEAPPPAAPDGPRSSTGLSAGGSEAQYYRSVARVGLQVADALAYAHKQGVLHRDVKPSNLMLDPQGTVWITDFGLAKAEGGDELTATGDVVGTVRFLAPERFEGRSLPQSDLYSLGLTLYELLTLRPAFDGSNKARLIERVLHEPPVPPRKRDPHVPRDLETIVLTCLAKDVGGRYATAEALAEDLRRFLADRPIRARRASSAERLWRWCRRNPVVASLLGVVAVVLLVGTAVSTHFAIQATHRAEQAQNAQREARLGQAEALVGQAHGIRYSRRSGQRFEALAALDKAATIGREVGQPPEWFDRLRNEAIAALALPDLHITHSWDGFPPGTHRTALSTDFELYARTTKQGACSIRRVADDVEIARLREIGEPTSVTFGSGRLLAVRGETSGRCQLWDLNTPEPVCRLEQQHVHALDFRPDGRLIAVSSSNGSISVYQTDTGNRRHFLEPKGITLNASPFLHPTEPIVAICSYWSNMLQVRDLHNGGVLVSLTLPWRGSWVCPWSPDGRTLAVSEGDGGRVHLYAFDLAAPSLRLTRALQAHTGGGTLVCFNAAGDRLAAHGWGGSVDLFDVTTGPLLFSTKLQVVDCASFLFDRTGKRLGAARMEARDNQIGLWSVADAREYRVLLSEEARHSYGHSRQPAVHQDGRLAALGMADGVAVWDVETGRQVAFVNVPGGGGNVSFEAGSLLSNASAGCFRWSVRPDPTKPGRLIIGPPERLPFPSGDRSIAASRDGQVIAQTIYRSGGWVLHPRAPQARRVESEGSFWVSVSPDGCLVAFGGNMPHVNVYEAATGRRVWQSSTDDHCYCRFSRDGRWLVTDNDGVRAYRVGTWEPGPRLGPGTPWDISPDSRLVVLGLSEGVHRLVELATGRELARLEDPEQNAYSPAVFTPDGTRLVVSANDGLRVWDLRHIRAELTRLGLDWDALPYPEAPEATPGPLEVRVVGADRIGRNPTALNNQAWQLVTGPAEQRDPATALQLIQEAVKLQPENATLFNTLGVVQYRNGLFKEAAGTLEKSLAASKGQSDAFDLFFLAMCHAKLGNPAKAKDCFERAVKWVEAQKNLKPERAAELKDFRAEAEAVLGLK
jgi:serine/threonine protein kinase/WD40 repeat protein